MWQAKKISNNSAPERVWGLPQSSRSHRTWAESASECSDETAFSPVGKRKLLTLTFHELHPKKLTWIPKMMGWKRNSLFTWQLLVFFERFLGCIGYWLVNGMDFEIHAWLKSWSGLQLASVYTTHYCSFSTGGRGKLLGFTSVEINIR